MKFHKGEVKPEQSGTYLALIEIDYTTIVTQAEYCKPGDLWTVEFFQVDTTLPHSRIMEEAFWQPIPVKCVQWTDDFPWMDFS